MQEGGGQKVVGAPVVPQTERCPDGQKMAERGFLCFLHYSFRNDNNITTTL